MQAEEQTQSGVRSALREIVETILFTLLIYVLVRTFLFENYRVVGRSMEPTLENDQFLVVNKLGYRLHEPQRGDIIVFRDPRSDERKLIKRVIGLPGETVEIRNNQVFINDHALDEDYTSGPPRYTPESDLDSRGTLLCPGGQSQQLERLPLVGHPARKRHRGQGLGVLLAAEPVGTDSPRSLWRSQVLKSRTCHEHL